LSISEYTSGHISVLVIEATGISVVLIPQHSS
jgi:hypothetical protein